MTKCEVKNDNYGFLTWRNSETELSVGKTAQRSQKRKDQDSLLCEPSICHDLKENGSKPGERSKPNTTTSWWKAMFRRQGKSTTALDTVKNTRTASEHLRPQMQKKEIRARRCQSMVFTANRGLGTCQDDVKKMIV